MKLFEDYLLTGDTKIENSPNIAEGFQSHSANHNIQKYYFVCVFKSKSDDRNIPSVGRVSTRGNYVSRDK